MLGSTLGLGAQLVLGKVRQPDRKPILIDTLDMIPRPISGASDESHDCADVPNSGLSPHPLGAVKITSRSLEAHNAHLIEFLEQEHFLALCACCLTSA